MAKAPQRCENESQEVPMHLLALLLIAAPAHSDLSSAPADTYPTTRGTAGVAFYLPGGSDTRLVGGTYFVFNDLAARVDFSLNAPLSPGGPGQNTIYSLGVGLRFYRLKRNRVAVFLQPVIALGREPSPAVTAEAAVFFRLGGGVGVEYFFTNHFSAGATLELTLKFANLSSPAGTPVYTSLSTATSGLSANFYF
jgi:hypothetical protein